MISSFEGEEEGQADDREGLTTNRKGAYHVEQAPDLLVVAGNGESQTNPLSRYRLQSTEYNKAPPV